MDIEQIILHSQSNDKIVVQAAIHALEDFALQTDHPTPALIRALDEGGDPGFRLRAIQLLGKVKNDSQTAVRALVHVLEEYGAVEAAIEAIGNFGPDASEAIPILTDIVINGDSWSKCTHAANALANIGGPAVHGLSEALRNGYWFQRQKAAMAMEFFQPGIKAAISVLEDTIANDGDLGVRTIAVKALEKLCPEPSAPEPEPEPKTKTIGFQDMDEILYSDDLKGAVELAFPKEQLTPIFIDMLANKDRQIREAGVLALGEVDAPDEEVKNALLHASEDKEPKVRLAVISALKKMNLSLEECLKVYKHRLKDESTKVRSKAHKALAELGAAAKDYIFIPKNKTALATADIGFIASRKPGEKLVEFFNAVREKFQVVEDGGPKATHDSQPTGTKDQVVYGIEGLKDGCELRYSTRISAEGRIYITTSSIDFVADVIGLWNTFTGDDELVFFFESEIPYDGLDTRVVKILTDACSFKSVVFKSPYYTCTCEQTTFDSQDLQEIGAILKTRAIPVLKPLHSKGTSIDHDASRTIDPRRYPAIETVHIPLYLPDDPGHSVGMLTLKFSHRVEVGLQTESLEMFRAVVSVFCE